MGKKSSRKLVGDIAECLTNEPQSIKEISNCVDADRQSVTKYLEELKNASIVKEEKTGRSRKFYISKFESNETYFGLPISKQDKQKFKALFNKIFEKYYNKLDKTPSKLMFQKIAVKVIKESGLDLPVGRYKYGSITAMNYTPGPNYEQENYHLGEDVEQEIESTIRDYGTLSFQEARLKQYKEEGMELYQIKENLMQDLVSEIDDKRDFQKKLYRFLSKTPEIDKETEGFLIDFLSITTDLIGDQLGRSQVIKTFKEIWELLAIYCLESDLKKYYKQEILDSRLDPKKEEEKEEVKQLISELIALRESEKNNQISKELREIKGSASELSKEQKEEKESELRDIDHLDVAREFDLDA